MKVSFTGVLRLTLAMLMSSLIAGATEKAVTVTIKVNDGHGAEVAEAEIKINSPDGKIVQKIATDKSGTVRVSLDPQKYEVTVTSPGFRTFHREIVVTSEKDQKIEFSLQVGGCPPDCQMIPER